jgi:hypothetical protein
MAPATPWLTAVEVKEGERRRHLGAMCRLPVAGLVNVAHRGIRDRL